MKKLILLLLITQVVFSQGIFEGNIFYEQAEQTKQKSLFKAIVLSALLPGAGEIYLGERNWGYGFIAVDGAIWASAIAFRIKGDWTFEECRWFSARYAGASPEIEDKDFYRIVGLYPSREIYNLLLLQSGYGLEDLLPDSLDWTWRNESDQLRYYDLWTSSQRALRNFRIALGVAALNRVLSVINVVRIKRIGTSRTVLRARLNRFDGEVGLNLSLTFRF